MVLWQNVSMGFEVNMSKRKVSWAVIGAVSTLVCCCAGMHFGLWSHLFAPLSWAPQENLLKLDEQNTTSSEDAPNIPIVQTPKFLDGVIPKDVNGFAMQDVDGQPGKYKLVVWCQSKYTAQHQVEGWRSKIELFAVEADTHATEIWQSDDEELYEPKISVVPQWQCHGHQVYLVLRQAGAAAELVDPVWVENGVVHKLPQVLADYFEIKKPERSDFAKTQLIGYSRCPQSFEMPKFYQWNGEGFVVNESQNISARNLSKFRG
jgi:hypothetical protein